MATIGGAHALHMEKEIGSLEPGKKADLILVDTSAPHATPMYNVYSELVYASKANDVRTEDVGRVAGQVAALSVQVATLGRRKKR